MRLALHIIKMAGIRREAGTTNRRPNSKELLPPLPATTYDPQDDEEQDLLTLMEVAR